MPAARELLTRGIPQPINSCGFPELRLTMPVVSAKEALHRGGPQLRNFSTEEFLGSGVPGHPRVVSIQLGKSKGGLTKGGLSPKFSEKIGGKSFLRNRAFSGQIGTLSGPIGAFSGPIGTNSSAPHSHGGRAEIAPKGPFLAQLAPFGPSPPLLSPPLDFPDPRVVLGRPELRILIVLK